jgi:hypothetical protein
MYFISLSLLMAKVEGFNEISLPMEAVAANAPSLGFFLAFAASLASWGCSSTAAFWPFGSFWRICSARS